MGYYQPHLPRALTRNAGDRARLEWVENRGEKRDIISMKDSPTKPGFEGDERVGVEGGSGELYIV